MHSGAEDAAEPNMTPLLDLVLQLVMFFMISANFLMEQSSEEVVLPISQMAKPPEPKDSSLIFININTKGEVLVTGRQPMNLAATKTWLAGEHRDAKAKGGGAIDSLVIVRAHKEATFSQVFEVMSLCKAVGFNRLQLRAIKK